MSSPTRKETITRVAEATFVHRRVLNGHGEFAFVRLQLVPLSRDAGEQFSNQAPLVPPQFVIAIARRIDEVARSGGTFGLPVVDFRATLLDARHHEMDSNERVFAIAAEGAFREALSEAGSIVLPS